MPTSHAVRLLACAGLLASASLVRADEPAERQRLLTEAADANRKAIESIRTLSVTLDVQRTKTPSSGESLEPEAPLGPGLFRRSADGYRLKTTRGDGYIGEVVGRYGRGLTLGRGGPLRDPEFFVTPAEHEHRLWIWTELLFSHPGPAEGESFPFYGLIREPHKLLAADRDGGDPHVSLAHTAGRLDLWFSAPHAGLVRKRVWRPTRKEYHHEWEVIAFAEPDRGVFVPTTVEHRIIRNDRPVEVRRTTLTDVQVNRPLPADALRIPGLTELTFSTPDFSTPQAGQPTRMLQYTVDADGYRQEVVSETTQPSAGVVLRPIVATNLGGGQPPAEPQLAPWWVWGGLISLGIVLAAAGFEIVNLRRQLREAIANQQR